MTQREITKEIITKYILIMSLKEEMQGLFNQLDTEYSTEQSKLSNVG